MVALMAGIGARIASFMLMVMTKRVNFSSGSSSQNSTWNWNRNTYGQTGRFFSFAWLSCFNHHKWILSLPRNFFPFVLFLFPLQLGSLLLLLKPQSLYDQLLSLLQSPSGLNEPPNSLQLPLFLQTMLFLFCFDPSVQTDFYWDQTITITSPFWSCFSQPAFEPQKLLKPQTIKRKWYKSKNCSYLAVLFRCFLCCSFSFTCSLSMFMHRRRCIRNWDFCCRKRFRCSVTFGLTGFEQVWANIRSLPFFSVHLGQSEATAPVGQWGRAGNKDGEGIRQSPTMQLYVPETDSIRWQSRLGCKSAHSQIKIYKTHNIIYCTSIHFPFWHNFTSLVWSCGVHK